jgi:hypothetical protein
VVCEQARCLGQALESRGRECVRRKWCVSGYPMARVRWFTHAHSRDGPLSGRLIVREDLGMCPVDANVGCPVVFKDEFSEELWPVQKIVPLNIILAPHPKSQAHYMVLHNSAAYLTPPSQPS